MKSATWMMATGLVGMMLMAAGPVQAAVDADAARALAKGNDCLKCHAIDKDKKGPSMQKIAAKYKGKADGQDKVIKGMTDGKKVRLTPKGLSVMARQRAISRASSSQVPGVSANSKTVSPASARRLKSASKRCRACISNSG